SAVQDDGAVEAFEMRKGVRVGRPRVDDDGLAQVARETELRVEQVRLRVVRRIVAEVVEPDLPQRDGLRMREQAAQEVEVVWIAGVVRMNADDRVHAVV